MSKYADDLERNVRVRRLVDEWTRSGLLTPAQQTAVIADVPVDVRRTNRFLRVTMGAFGLLIIAATVALVVVTLKPNEEQAAGVICLIAAAGCIALAEFLISRFRLYRFGVEEACAIGAVVLAGVGSGLLFSDWYVPVGDRRILIALLAGSAAAWAVYRRYGLVYGAFAAMLGLGLAPSELGLRDIVQRSIAFGAIGACLIVAREKHRQHGDEYPGDDYGLIEAAAWAGAYAVVNLHLGGGWFANRYPAWFVWLTYGAIWLLPAVALWLSVREKNRPLLDVGLVMAIGTLVTNKPYLGLERKPWDPILLGALLIGAAIAVRRWLTSGPDGLRGGFTSAQTLRSDEEVLARVAAASTAFQPGIAPRATEPPPADPFGGGRSGGGGAGASY